MSAADRLNEIEARANAATKGPWHRYGTWPYEVYAPREPDGGPYIASMTGDDGHNESNAEFIAHARTDVPALVAALRAVQEVLDKRGKQAREALPPSLAALAVPSYQFNVRASDVIRAIEEALS